MPERAGIPPPKIRRGSFPISKRRREGCKVEHKNRVSSGREEDERRLRVTKKSETQAEKRWREKWVCWELISKTISVNPLSC